MITIRLIMQHSRLIQKETLTEQNVFFKTKGMITTKVETEIVTEC